jgi:hypothetical protein
MYKLSGDDVYFYAESLPQIYYKHQAFHHLFRDETAEAFDLLVRSHLLTHVTGTFYRTYKLTDRGVELAKRSHMLISYLEHSLKMQEVWQSEATNLD